MNPQLRLVISVDGALRRIHPVMADTMTLGRGSDCELVLDDTLVSRRHSRIARQHGRLWVEDLDSANGTYLNGKRIDRSPFVVGDRLEVGPFQLVLEQVAQDSPDEQTLQGRPTLQQPPQGQELELLLTLLQSLDAGVPRAQALDRLLTALLKAMQAARAFLFRWDVKRQTPRVEISIVADGADRGAPVSESLVKKVAREREPYLLTDLDQRAEGEAPSLTRLAAGNVQSVLLAPLKVGRKLVGILYLDSPAARRSFATTDLDLLTRAATYLAGLLDAIEEREELAQENQRLRDLVGAGGSTEVPIDRLVSAGSPMAPVVETIKRAAARDVSVLLTGETGTGKEVAARAVHRLSSRAAGRFVAINCGAIPESLIESELFGYRKGAFSGANEDRAGQVEMAHQGTLFLDELGELPLSAQVRLLRVLEERQVVRLGSSDPVPVDFRLVAATHRDLAARVEEGTFRRDLYYRLNVFAIQLPPLRERLADLPLLVEYLIGSVATRLGVPVIGAAPDLVPVLARYSWPGNVRELRNVLERALVLEDGERLTAKHLPPEVTGAVANTTATAAPVNPPSAAPGVRLKSDEANGVRKWADVLKDVERAYLKSLMQQVGANVTAMARVSGMSRLTIYRKLGSFGLELPGGPPPDEEDGSD